MHADDVEKILFSEEDLSKRVKELGAEITRDYADKVDEGIIVVAILNGAAIFMTDLVRAINLPIDLEFMAVSSYGDSTTSSGRVRILKDLGSSIEGKHVIIAEDILDTGLTLSYVEDILQHRNPASIAVCALLRKDRPDQADVHCQYEGFTCPNEFMIGYGLDYAGKYRNLPFIGAIKPECI